MWDSVDKHNIVVASFVCKTCFKSLCLVDEVGRLFPYIFVQDQMEPDILLKLDCYLGKWILNQRHWSLHRVPWFYYYVPRWHWQCIKVCGVLHVVDSSHAASLPSCHSRWDCGDLFIFVFFIRHTGVCATTIAWQGRGTWVHALTTVW